MAKEQKRDDFADARDRLFHEIRRCGVLEAASEEARAWLDDTIQYLGEQYPSLTKAELVKLRLVGDNYVAPAIPHGAGKDATNREEWGGSDA